MKSKRIYNELENNKFHIIVSDSVSSAMHGHNFLEFSYVKSGCMKHKIGNVCEIVNKGDYFIVDYGTMHEYKSISDEPLIVINFLFRPEFIERTLTGCESFEEVVNSYLVRFSYKALNSSPTGKAFHDNDGSILQTADKIINEYYKKNSGYFEYIRCLFIEILILTMRKIGKNDYKTNESFVINQIIEYIKQHYKENIHLSQLALQYNYSLSHLSKKFKQEMNMCFSDYLKRIRIEQSCRLLENSDYKISEIANLVGYENIKFFNKIFKENLKMTPREFKNHLGK